MKKNIAIFASGSGTNAENIIHYFKENDKVTIKIVVSNKDDAYVLERARKENVPSVVCPKEQWQIGEEILSLMKKNKIDFIVLAGFLLKIPQLLLHNYPHRIINIHPALLPRHGGKGMYGNKVHEAVVTAKEKESGITIHYIDENYDEGQTFFQAKCEILPSDTADEVAAKVHALEYKWFPTIIERAISELQ
jgi:phosphoribosylglycinamide formyltransferase-1